MGELREFTRDRLPRSLEKPPEPLSANTVWGKRWIHDGLLNSRRISGFSMDCWIRDEFLDSRQVVGFTTGSWINDRFLDSRSRDPKGTLERGRQI